MALKHLVLAGCICYWVPSAGAADVKTAEQVVGQVQRFYRTVHDLKGKVKQTFRHGLYGQKKVTWGYLYAKPPTKFRLKYVKTQTSQFISDGKEVWMWEPDSNQAYRSQDRRIIKGLRFLIGAADLKKEFVISEHKRPPHGRMRWYLHLRPKKPTVQYKHIVLGIRKDYAICEATLVKKDTTNRFELQKIAVNSGVSNSTFNFKPPLGTNVKNMDGKRGHGTLKRPSRRPLKGKGKKKNQ